MPGSTYTPIATATGTGSSNTITFSSIPSTYTDLVVVAQMQANSNDYVNFRINNDTGSNYSNTQVYGTGSSAGSARASSQTSVLWEAIPSSPNVINSIIHFQNYSNATTYKTALLRSNDANSVVRAIVTLWRSTSAINRLDFYNNTNSFTTATTFTLYGIAAA